MSLHIHPFFSLYTTVFIRPLTLIVRETDIDRAVHSLRKKVEPTQYHFGGLVDVGSEAPLDMPYTNDVREWAFSCWT